MLRPMSEIEVAIRIGAAAIFAGVFFAYALPRMIERAFPNERSDDLPGVVVKSGWEDTTLCWSAGTPKKDGEYLALVYDRTLARVYRREVVPCVGGEWGIWGTGEVLCWIAVPDGWEEYKK